MHHTLKSISYIFHPLTIPILGVIFYFDKTRRYIPESVQYGKLVSIGILTIILPLLLFLLLKTIRQVNSIHLRTTKERIFPLLLNCIIVVLILKRVLPQNEILELYFFFLGILCSSLACLILAIANVKASIHMIALSGLLMFMIAIGIHFKININGTIALMCLIIGAVATSRLHLKAHSTTELIIGVFIGLMPQLLLVNFWM